MVNIKTFTIDLNNMKLLIQQKVTEFEVEAMEKVFSESQKKKAKLQVEYIELQYTRQKCLIKEESMKKLKIFTKVCPKNSREDSN